MKSSFQLMIAYDMFYYVKFTAFFIETICWGLSLLVLKILAVEKRDIKKFFSTYDSIWYVLLH